MKGLDLCENFYLDFGVPMLRDGFSEIEDLLAVGIGGSGSECFGYDDDISRDHDFESGFCIFLPDESLVNRKIEFELERAYSRLPKEYKGFLRSPLSPVGGNRHGVIRIGEFIKDKTGTPDGVLSLGDWFMLSEQTLLEATNGRLFRDGLGLLTSIRERLAYFPDDVRLKKLAGNLLIMGQAGQYNYARCLSRGETAAAQLSVIEFVKATVNVLFLLNRRYQPYYKWCFRALRELPLLSSLHAPLEFLISSGNGAEVSSEKIRIIEEISREVIAGLAGQGLSDHKGNQLEAHAYAVNDRITDNHIRTLHILYAIV